MLTQQLRYYHVPAISIAVVDKYRVAWTYATGFADVASRSAATTSTLFQAASMSKPVSAAAILALFEERHLDLNADVNTMLRSWHVPHFGSGADGVTMRRLLSHNAGVNVGGFVGYDRDAALPTLAQVLDGVAPANNEPIRVTEVPGTVTRYSGGGTTIAQQVAVDVSGMAFPAFMRRTLLAPLGMADSTFEQPLPQTMWSRAADGYYGDGKPVHRGWHVYPTMAAAGLWTTPSDLAKFVIAIQNALRGQGRPPIDSTVAGELTTPVSDSFALGPGVQPGYFAHSGANEGFQGTFYGLIGSGRGVVIMTNSDNGLLLADEIVHSVATAYRWPVLQPKARKAIAPSTLATREILGSYATRFDQQTVTLTIARSRDGLVLKSSIAGTVAQPLYAEARLRFFTLDGGELEFRRDATGRLTSLVASGTTYTRVR